MPPSVVNSRFFILLKNAIFCRQTSDRCAWTATPHACANWFEGKDSRSGFIMSCTCLNTAGVESSRPQGDADVADSCHDFGPGDL